MPGVWLDRTIEGFPVFYLHHTADPDKQAEWAKEERKKYTSMLKRIVRLHGLVQPWPAVTRLSSGQAVRRSRAPKLEREAISLTVGSALVGTHKFIVLT